MMGPVLVCNPRRGRHALVASLCIQGGTISPKKEGWMGQRPAAAHYAVGERAASPKYAAAQTASCVGLGGDSDPAIHAFTLEK